MFADLPPLNSIKVFDAAARLGSFKKAAEELHVTPTAVSHQIKTLEETLGTLLFMRKTRAIELTDEGKLLADTSYNILQKLANTLGEISSNKNSITVSATSSFAAMWLVPNLSKFNERHPEIDVAIKTSEQVVDIEKDKSIDLAIRYGNYNADLKNSVLLTTEEIAMYATPSYIESINGADTINLLETKWKNKNFAETSWKSLQLGTIGNELTQTNKQFDQEHHVIQAALASQGIALVSSLLVQNAIEQGWLAKYNIIGDNKKINGFSYYLVVPEHNQHSKCVDAFKHWIKSELS